mgnify:FL=1
MAANVQKQKRKQVQHTVEFKLKILEELDNNKRIKDIVLKYGIPQNTISTWKKGREKILKAASMRMTTTKGKDRKRGRDSAFPEVERALLVWLKEMRSRPTPPPIDLSALMAKAEV